MSGNVVVEPMDEDLAVVRLQRSPVNALNPIFLGEIGNVLRELQDDHGVRAIILTGTGKVLSAGMDLKEAVAFSPQDQTAMIDALNTTYAVAYELTKPLIVAANGHAIAGGLFFVLIGDYRIVSDRALLGLTEVRVGVNFPVVANEIACHELGANAARRIMLSGQNITAAQALGLGFIDDVCDAGVIMQRAIAKSRELAAVPPRAYAAVKRQVRGSVIARYRDAIDNGNDPARDGWFTEETHAAAKAILASG